MDRGEEEVSTLSAFPTAFRSGRRVRARKRIRSVPRLSVLVRVPVPLALFTASLKNANARPGQQMPRARVHVRTNVIFTARLWRRFPRVHVVAETIVECYSSK